VITRSDLEYELPPELIAQHPAEPRDSARLLLVERTSGRIEEHRFHELPALCGAEDLFVVNDTRVVPAKLRGRKESGGRAEALLLERRPDGTWLALVRCGGRVRPGLVLRFGALRAEVLELRPDGTLRLEISPSETGALEELLLAHGEAPLPPYIRRSGPLASDLASYQTLFARVPGAVAAPTAGLHFSADLIAKLRIASVTLHVGPGTFQPIRCERLEQHALAPEAFEIPQATARSIAAARAAGGHAVAVGTTVVRALETNGAVAGAGHTALFITPGHRFRAVDELITNFHLPGSTLLALVMAFGGIELVRRAYAFAIAARFRFYSYGDAMWIR
jgi:S-adenosylmethionine:tRNA ribosyltransferase-isomerase